MKHFNKSIVDRTSSDIKTISPSSFDLVCRSEFRWDSISQRSQHLLNRCAKDHRVFFIEEPTLEFISSWWLEVTERDGVWIVVPHIPDWVSDELVSAMHQSLMDDLFEKYQIVDPARWQYKMMADSCNRQDEYFEQNLAGAIASRIQQN